MATNEDWWGYLIFVFFIMVIIFFVIKIGLEFPGLFEWNFLCSNFEDESSESEMELEEENETVIVDLAVAQARKDELKISIDKSDEW
jgi:hypothetical protein